MTENSLRFVLIYLPNLSFLDNYHYHYCKNSITIFGVLKIFREKIATVKKTFLRQRVENGISREAGGTRIFNSYHVTLERKDAIRYCRIKTDAEKNEMEIRPRC